MPLFFIKGWVLISVGASLLGWVLGLSEQLHAISYVWLFFCLTLLIALFWKRTDWATPKKLFPIFRYLRRYYQKPSDPFSWLPLLFFLTALLSFLGGILNSPSNYDALSYRLPRILHWLDADRWYWIDTPNMRQNYSAAGFEWLAIPLFLLLKNDRLLFLINWASYLLLPGLIFRMFRLAKINLKSCWCWMWIFPLAYGFVQQAGSIGNDAFATIYALSAVCFVFSADKKAGFSNFGWAILSVGLLTGTKGSNIPLVLPWFVAMLLRYKEWLPSGLKLLPWTAVSLMVSFMPVAILNYQHTGSWNGDPVNEGKLSLSQPAAGLLGNSLMLAYCSLQPPILPFPTKVNRFTTDLLPAGLKQWLLAEFPRFQLKMGEIPMEESAGLGFGLIACLFLWIFLGRAIRTPESGFWVEPWFLLGLAGLGSLLFYMAKMGSESTARLLLPYYPFLFLLPLGFRHLPVCTIRKWAPAFFLFSSSALVGLIASPARPLFPKERLLNMVGKDARFCRLRIVYETYIHRPRCWDPILAILPPGVQTLGFFSHEDDLEAPLWRPYSIRRIVSADENHPQFHQLPSAQAWLARRSIAQKLQSIAQWDQSWRVVGSSSITQKAAVGPEEWVLFLPR